MELIKEYKSSVLVNRRSYETIVRIFAEPDPDCTQIGESFDFGSLDENKAYLERFESGEVLSTLISVKVSLNGFSCVTGSDYLGACHVSSRDLKDDVLTTVEDHGMVQVAETELKESIKSLTKVLVGV